MKLEIYGSRREGGYCAHGEYEPGVDTPLLPCPFCNLDGSEIEGHNTHTPSYWIECPDCGAEGPRDPDFVDVRRTDSRARVEQLHRASLDRVIALWNRRLP